MKLHWSPRSPFVRKVMIFVHETDLVDRVEKIRSVTNMLRPNLDLMQWNPWSKIPTLVTDEGRVLFDSDVICEYLDEQHRGRKLLPVDTELRWPALRWRAFGGEMLDVLILWRNERERPPERQLPQLIEAFSLKLSTGLAFLEREAEELMAAPFSVGHIAIGCALGYLEWRFADHVWRTAHPRLAGWYNGFKQRPSVIATEPIDDSPRRNAAGKRTN
ncbi:MAG: glutathione S-transferase family protein [Steroidobacteraceae bacterium]|jgi:glutathione S-transferase